MAELMPPDVFVPGHLKDVKCIIRYYLKFVTKRLTVLREQAKKIKREGLYPDDLEPGHKYVEGARKQVHINAWERDPRARTACLRHHGHSCAVCGLVFEKRYGRLGRGFIHVHHIRPGSLTKKTYELNPKQDLIPVCPNCHAMLHRPKRVLSVEQLRKRLKAQTG